MAHSIRDFEGLLGLRTAYLQALDAGDGEFTVELPPGAYGLHGDEASGTLSLAPVEGAAAIDVRLVAPGGPCTLVGIPLQIAARRVTLENVGFVATGSTALGISASAGIELRGVTVLDCEAGRRQRAAVDLSATGEGARLELERVVVARATAPAAAVGAFVNAGAWWASVHLDACALGAREAPALLAVESTAELAITDCALRAPEGGHLVWMNWLPATARVQASALAAGALDTFVLPGPPPAETPAIPLDEETLVTAPAGEFPGHVDAARAQEAAGETVDARLAERVEAATDALLAAAPELLRRLG